VAFTIAAYTGPDNYTNAQGVSWTFNNLATNQSEAQAMCNKQCGHLASYTSAQEQYDVEQFYISNVRSKNTCLSCAGGLQAKCSISSGQAVGAELDALYSAGPAHPQVPPELLDGPAAQHLCGHHAKALVLD
jgi:hypothetical protein